MSTSRSGRDAAAAPPYLLSRPARDLLSRPARGRLARPARLAAVFVLGLASCHDPAPILVPLADGIVVAPEAGAERYTARLAVTGARRLLVPWTSASTDVQAIAEAARGAQIELVLGLTPTRRPEDGALGPPVPDAAIDADLDAAIDRALLAGDAASALHLDHLELGLPDARVARDLGAVAARVAARTPLPLGVAIPAPARALDGGAEAAGAAWARAWAEALRGPLRRVLVVVDDPSADLEGLRGALAELRRGLGEDVTLWVSVDARASVAGAPRLGGAPIAPARARPDLERSVRILRTEVDVVLVAGAEAFEPTALFSPAPETRALPDARADLEAEARGLSARIRRTFIREGQVLGRVDASEPLDRGRNLRPESTVDLTAYWAAASALRFGQTRDAEARADAREAWRALHALARATPVRGDIARAFTRALDDAAGLAGTGTTARWTRSPDRALYFVAGATPDELAAWVLGAAAHHALTADETERAEIAEDMKTILDEVLVRGLPGAPARAEAEAPSCARLGASSAPEPEPLIRVALFQAGAAITGDARHQAERTRLLGDTDLIACAAATLSDTSAPEPGAGRVSAVYLLFAFELDAARRAALEPILEALVARRRSPGDALVDVVSAVFRPGLDGGRRAVSALARFNPAFLDNAGWLGARIPLEPASGLPPPEALRPIPLERRPGARLDFGGASPVRIEGGLEDRFSGATFLLTYWMARYHGVTCVGR